MDATEGTLATVTSLLADAPVLGAELETGYRVLAVTVEPAADDHPRPDASDPRVQVLFHPVSRVAAVLADASVDPPVLHRFTDADLVEVVARFDGATGSWRVDDPGLDPSRWAPELSLDGASKAIDGRLHHAQLDLDDGAGLRLRLGVWFDEVEVRGPDGTTLVGEPRGPVF